MYKFLLSLRSKTYSGSFIINSQGEEDMRGVYIAVILSKLLNFDCNELLKDTADYIASC